MSITRRQADVLQAIRAFIDENAFSPTYDEVGQKVGEMTGGAALSKTSVYEHVECLIKKGYLTRGEQNKSRNLILIEQTRIKLEDAVEAVTTVLAGYEGAEDLCEKIIEAINGCGRYGA
jgi:SOS-response transcriptional repressor LexA